MIKLIMDSNGVHSDIEPNFNMKEIRGKRAPKMLFAWGGRISCAGPAYYKTATHTFILSFWFLFIFLDAYYILCNDFLFVFNHSVRCPQAPNFAAQGDSLVYIVVKPAVHSG
jgi:hypothetical protein